MPSKSFLTLCSMEHLTKAWEDVKAKRAGGGIDGETLATFGVNLHKNLSSIRKELLEGTWEPFPYLRIEIPKKVSQKRQIGMLTVKDKVVQQAIRLLIEPSCEKMFLPCSYGYRPGKGAVTAVRKVKELGEKPENRFTLRLDIDDYFNHIDHDRLERRVRGIVQDEELIRLIMLCVKMGAVSRRFSWLEPDAGVHQGSVLSPCLSNLYLHGFDVFVMSKTSDYVRYADDFVLFCKTREEAEGLLVEIRIHLADKLGLSLNPPVIAETSETFEFLGIAFHGGELGLSQAKEETLLRHISEFRLIPEGLPRHCAKKWNGIGAFYGKLLSPAAIQKLDEALYVVLHDSISSNPGTFKSRAMLSAALSDIHFLSGDFKKHEAAIMDTLADEAFPADKPTGPTAAKKQNRTIVLKRKHEYRKLEEAQSELVISRPGVALGLAKNRITIKEKGVVVKSVPVVNLKHISVISDGVSLSTNILRHVMENKIPMDFFACGGRHLGSFLSASSLQCSLWQSQALCPAERRNRLGAAIIDGKLTNQLNLVKYFHKYHKARTADYQKLLEDFEGQVDAYKAFMKTQPYEDPGCIGAIMAYESQGALRYWAYIRVMLEDDGVGFEGRTGHGAGDLVNSMLNYGYAILYARVWHALLRARLNPYDSIIHARQAGKPTFVYDVVELFRAQAVDRVVFSLVQKKEPVEVRDGLLTDDAKRLLVKNITERMQKRENYRGEEISLEKIIGRQAGDIADFFVSGKRYLPYKAKW